MAFITLGILAVPADPFSTSATQTAVSAPTPQQVVARDGNSKVWQWETYEPSPNGTVVPHIHGYTELATGLNYQRNGQWLDSKEEIDLQPNGTASATQGQHQAYFPADIYQGQIELVTPDGLHLQSRPVGLSYDDGTNTVMIAVLTNSAGYLVGSNQVIYPDAFTGFKADLIYTYTKAGFEQDVVLRQQPPTSDSLGLNPGTAKLQVFTEFFDPPRPAIQSTTLPVQAGLSLPDESLAFGQMEMVPGKAFVLGTNSPSARVGKQWVQVQGRQFLIEEVPVDAILEGLAALPSSALNTTKPAPLTAKHLVLPPQRLAKYDTSKTILLAKAAPPAKGLVLDYYLSLTNSVTNYVFQADTTYYISGQLTLKGTNTFEGGTVIKYATNGTLLFASSFGGARGTVYWQASAYRPAIFTAKDDNSVGDTISGSTGNPTNYYAFPALNFTFLGSSSVVIVPGLSHFRIAYARTAINTADTNLSVSDGQFINCGTGIIMSSPPNNSNETNYLGNVLFANVGTVLNIGDYINQPYGSLIFNVENVTFSGAGCLGTLTYDGNNQTNCFINFMNCVLAGVTNLCVTNYYFGASMGVPKFNGANNGFYNSPAFGAVPVTNTFYPFQSTGAGNYYLTNGTAFRDAGTTNIDTNLLAELQITTTYAPPDGSWPDTNTPDLGYHYVVPTETITSEGTNFWLAFYYMSHPGTNSFTLAISSPVDASGTVTIPGLRITNTFSVAAGAVAKVSIPLAEMMIDYDAVETNGIHVISTAPVAVYALNYNIYSSTAFTGYPTSFLGTNYCVLSYPSCLGTAENGDIRLSEFAIVATADGTTVTIMPSPTANLAGSLWTNSFILNAGQTYQINVNFDPYSSSTNDVTGTWVTSDKPVAVFAGASGADVPGHVGAANPLVQEQMPVNDWGIQALSMGFAGRTNGDSYRILAAYTNTVLTFSGLVVTVTDPYDIPPDITSSNEVVVTNLDAGQFCDIIVQGPVEFQASHPIQVAHFANGIGFDGFDGIDNGDPAEILLPPTGHYLLTNTVVTLPDDNISGAFPVNYLSIIAAQAAITNTLVDGLHIAETNFVPIGTSGYYGAQITVTNSGAHTVTSSQPVHVEVYGFGDADAYGYFGGIVK